MPLLALPPELFHHTLSFLDWDSIISFLCTNRFVTEHIISKSEIALLRRQCRAGLMTWESSEREKRDWPLEPNPRRLVWYDQPEHMNGWLRDLETLPCYTCLRQVPLRRFTRGMMAGGHALGQKDAGRRVCIACGVRTNIYTGGCKMACAYAVCIKCGHLMNTRKGWLLHEEDLRVVKPRETNRRFDRELLFGDSAMMASRRFWWWKYSHECFECVLERGWTAQELFSKKIRLQEVKDRYAQGMIASMERRLKEGRAIRARLGVGEPQTAVPDTVAMKGKRNPFPKYQAKLPPSATWGTNT